MPTSSDTPSTFTSPTPVEIEINAAINFFSSSSLRCGHELKLSRSVWQLPIIVTELVELDFDANLPLLLLSLVVMDTSLLSYKFARIGARLKVVDRPRRRLRSIAGLLRLDIGSDRRGEFFEIMPHAGVDPEVQVLDVRPSDRHLLLLVREDNAKNKYLCGHDERHWFVAGIPETASVGTVRQAMEALQPREVLSSVARCHVSGKARNRRKNAAFIRQGEWFFLPAAEHVVNESLVLKHEPLSRGNGGKPHWVDFCCRTGGETVYVCKRHPNGVTDDQYRKILSVNSNAKNWGWTTMRRNPGVYVRGRVRHPDHATIKLHGWHQVVMNTENQSQAMRNVAFLD